MLPPPSHVSNLLLPERRNHLKAAAGALASLALPCFAHASDFWSRPRTLWLYRPDTQEMIKEVYWADGLLIPSGYIRICQLLRDIRINQAVQFDIVTLDIARGVYGWLQSLGIDKPIIINSGYRHPSTNATEGGVRNSLHTMARAIDIRIDGISTESIARFGMYLSGGGVGFYPGKKFTHLDRGKVRYWRG